MNGKSYFWLHTWSWELPPTPPPLRKKAETWEFNSLHAINARFFVKQEGLRVRARSHPMSPRYNYCLLYDKLLLFDWRPKKLRSSKDMKTSESLEKIEFQPSMLIASFINWLVTFLLFYNSTFCPLCMFLQHCKNCKYLYLPCEQ